MLPFFELYINAMNHVIHVMNSNKDPISLIKFAIRENDKACELIKEVKLSEETTKDYYHVQDMFYLNKTKVIEYKFDDLNKQDLVRCILEVLDEKFETLYKLLN